MSPGRDERLRVVLADPDPLVRRVLREQLRASGFVVAGDAGDGRDAVDLVRFYRPDLAVIESRLPTLDVVSVVRTIHADMPETQVVVLAPDVDEQLALDVLRAGAVGYLAKTAHVTALPRLLSKVAAGEAVLPRALGMRMLEHLRRMPDHGWRPLHSQLTTREWEIVELLSGGAGTHDIARDLVLSPATVYGHVKSIMRKLGVRSRAEAVTAAERLRPAEVELVA
jgi:two-component system nitrate/nitrite response regulator NarL